MLRGRLVLGGRVAIERNILGLPGYGVWIADLVTSDMPRAATWCWHMPDEARPQLVHQASSHALVRFKTGILATWTSDAGLKINVDRAVPDRPIAWQAPTYGSLVPGHRIGCTAVAATQRLVVTFIGKHVVPASVEVRGRHLACGAGGDASEVARTTQSSADIVWSVVTEDRTMRFAAGMTTLNVPPGWTALAGEGSWPAMCTEMPLK